MPVNVPRLVSLFSVFALLTGLAALSGCSSTPVAPAGEAVAPAPSPSPNLVLGQNALPPGAKLRPEQSLIMGAGDQWVGRVVADVGRDIDLAYRFFIDAYPAQGWTLISSVRGKTSLIVLTKQDRTATIELVEPTVVTTGSAVLTVSPRNASVVAPRKL